MYPQLADTFALLFYFVFWVAILNMINFSLFAYGVVGFHFWADALAACFLSYATTLIAKDGR